jgi:putative transcriptional regulator
MNAGDTKVKTAKDRKWAKFDAMTDDEVLADALTDPDARPLTGEDFASGKLIRTPQVKVIRRALRLSQEEFAAHYRIPIGTLRDWEQGRSQPDAPGRAYLTVIARKPDMVRDALEAQNRAG